MSDKCPNCGSDTECLAGESAHASNWYCEDVVICKWKAWEADDESVGVDLDGGVT